jgi:hypothetical protein
MELVINISAPFYIVYILNGISFTYCCKPYLKMARNMTKRLFRDDNNSLAVMKGVSNGTCPILRAVTSSLLTEGLRSAMQ